MLDHNKIQCALPRFSYFVCLVTHASSKVTVSPLIFYEYLQPPISITAAPCVSVLFDDEITPVAEN